MISDPIDPVLPLRERIVRALDAAFGDAAQGADPAVHRSAHAHFQADVALGLARRLGRKPRDIADALLAHLAPDDVIASAAVSGPGFINIDLRPTYLAGLLARMLADPRLGIPEAAVKQTVVVDYSAPNVAKEMHVGHLRSTIIGDSIARLLAFLGHTVVRQNHIGDWGTPFGMLIEQRVDQNQAGAAADLGELADFYRAARARFEADPDFAERARRRVVLLQGGDPATLALWQQLIDQSVAYFSEVYRRLGVTLTPADVAGESSYNAALPGLVAALEATGLARLSDGAMCVFPPGFVGRDDTPVPLIVRKQDGGYGYATTDLAAVRHRLQTLGATRLIYVVGAPQSQHFAMVFAAARLAGWAAPGVLLEHVAFGSVLGKDKKMLKSRAGESVRLIALIEEAIERARALVAAKSPELPPAVQAGIAEAVGIGAIKYADLASDRGKDYVFDWDRMLAFEGNTAPYLMYAHARVVSILAKAELTRDGVAATTAVRCDAPEERALALELATFPSLLVHVEATLLPHRLCTGMFEIATVFMRFYQACPVLKADPAVRAARLALCQLTARVLHRGLDLLGIGAPDRM